MLVNQVRDTMGDHSRLAAAGTGQYQEGTVVVAHGHSLLRIETFKEIHENEGRNADLSTSEGEPSWPRLKGAQRPRKVQNLPKQAKQRKKT